MSMAAVLARFSIIVMLAYAGIAHSASAYPDRVIRLIVSLPPGGGNDDAARSIASELSKRLGQQIIVDNRPGGASVIASQVVLAQPAAGHTIYMVSTNFNL